MVPTSLYILYTLVYFLSKNNNKFSSEEEKKKAIYWAFMAQLPNSMQWIDASVAQQQYLFAKELQCWWEKVADRVPSPKHGRFALGSYAFGGMARVCAAKIAGQIGAQDQLVEVQHRPNGKMQRIHANTGGPVKSCWICKGHHYSAECPQQRHAQ